MSGFSNRVGDAPASREATRQALGHAIAELDRLAALPAGHPDVLRAWGADQRVSVPAAVFEILKETEYEAFERELAEHLEGRQA